METEFNHLCMDCGTTANNMMCIRKFGSRAIKESYTVSTMHERLCDCCLKIKLVTELRDFFYPSERVLKALKRYLLVGSV